MPLATLAFPSQRASDPFHLVIDGAPYAVLRADYLEREGALVGVDVLAAAPAWLTAAEALRLGDVLLGSDPGAAVFWGPREAALADRA